LSVTCDRSVVFSGTPVSSTNKADRHDITEILLKVKVTLNTINQPTYNHSPMAGALKILTLYLHFKTDVAINDFAPGCHL